MHFKSIATAALFVFFATASVSQVEAKRSNKRKAPSRVGDYDGVKAGATSITPPGARRKGKRGPVVYWVGFQPLPAGHSQVFVQLGKEVEMSQSVVSGQLVVNLYGARIGNSAVQRRLDTRYFETSIQGIVTKRLRRRKGKGKRRGVQLIVSFKTPADAAEASASVVTETDGYSYVYLQFAPQNL